MLQKEKDKKKTKQIVLNTNFNFIVEHPYVRGMTKTASEIL